jgi:hypothetical protein
MAKAKVTTRAYEVTGLSSIAYNGKEVHRGDVVTDLPGIDIEWLLEGGYITPVDSPTPTPTEDDSEVTESVTEAPVEAETPEEGQ